MSAVVLEPVPAGAGAGGRRAPAWLVAVVGWCSSLRHLSLVAVLAWTAHAHWSLALLLGAPWWLAAALPVAVDCYVLASLRAWESSPERRHRDLAWALGLDGLAVSGAHAAHQVALPAPWLAAIAAMLGVVLVLVLWRVHALDVQVRHATRRHRPAAPPAAPVVTSPVTPAVAVVADVVARPVARVVAPPSGGLASWVQEQRAAGARRADVVRDGMALWGVSRRTVERRWDQPNG